MMSAAMTRRDLLYFTFDDKKQVDELRKINGKLKSRTVAEVFKIVISYNDDLNDNADNVEIAFLDFFFKQTSLHHCSFQ